MDPINEHYLMVSFSCGLEGLSLKTNFSNEGIMQHCCAIIDILDLRIF